MLNILAAGEVATGGGGKGECKGLFETNVFAGYAAIKCGSYPVTSSIF